MNRFAVAAVACFLAALSSAKAETVSADVVVYGGTPGGVTAAVAAARSGRSVVLIEPHPRVGGMTSGGLCVTDVGKRETIGGLAKEFFGRVHAFYRTKYGPGSAQAKACRNGELPEPHVAEHVFNEMLRETGRVKVLLRHRVHKTAVEKGRLAAVTALDLASGKSVECRGALFLDAGYEGDLLALAGVPYRVGRESRDEHGESFAGVNAGPPPGRGRGDHRVQAYNLRGTITSNPDLAVPFPRPKHYDPAPFLAYKQRVLRGRAKTFAEAIQNHLRAPLPNGKFDPNVADLTGVVQAYPEGDPAARQRVYERLRDHWLSLFYMLQNDPELPEAFRATAKGWGLPKDEYPENSHVTPQVYVREARRMIGRHVLTQSDVRVNRYKKDGVCLGSYNIDCHVVQLLTGPEGPQPEGGFIELTDPYEIPYGCLVPPNVSNLLVVCAVSATHVGYGSLRMEPVFMMLGHAAGLAAHQALERDCAVQAVDVAALREALRKQGALLDAPYRPVVAIACTPARPAPGEPVTIEVKPVDLRRPIRKVWWNLDGTGALQGTEPRLTHRFPVAKVYTLSVIVEDETGLKSDFTTAEVAVGGGTVGDVTVVAWDGGKLTGDWMRARARDYDRRLLYTDEQALKGENRAVFEAVLPRDGRYMVCLAYPAVANRDPRVPVRVRHAGGTAELTVDQRKADTPFVFKPLGEFRFQGGQGYAVEVRNEGTTGVVAVDAVKWVWLGE
jgi:hypothetical protein